MKQFFTFVLSLSFLISAHAQKQGQSLIDSLSRQLPAAKEDSNKVKLLLALAVPFTSVDPNKSLGYGNDALQLAGRLGWQKGVSLCYRRIGLTYSFKKEYSSALNYLQKSLNIAIAINDYRLQIVEFTDVTNVCLSQSKYAEALDYRLRALAVSEKQGYKKESFNILKWTGNDFANRQEYKNALEYWHKAELITDSVDHWDLAVLRDNMAVAFLAVNDSANAFKYYNRNLVLGYLLHDDHMISEALLHLGSVHLHFAESVKALDCFRRSLDIKLKTGDQRGASVVLIQIESIYNSQGDYVHALDFGLKALKLAEELNDKTVMASDMNDISIIYDAIRDFPRAREYMVKALRILEETDKKDFIPPALGNIGAIYSDEGNYSEALKYLKKSYELEKETGFPSAYDEANTLDETGDVYRKMHNYSLAIRTFYSALNVEQAGHEKAAMSKTLGNLGGTYLQLVNDTTHVALPDSLAHVPRSGLLRRAILLLRQAIDLSTKTGEPDNLRQQYQLLSEAEALAGDYKNALASYRQYARYNDSLFNNEKTKEFNRREIQFDADRQAAAAKAENEKRAAITAEKNRRSQLLWALTGAGLFIGSIYYQNMYRQRKLKAARLQLTSLARAKLHNIRSKYNSIYLLALQQPETSSDTGDGRPLTLLTDYIDKSSIYFKALLNGWKKEDWTIADELGLLQKFYESEIVVKRKVAILTDFAGVPVGKVKFMQEVFTTLLDNSMSYAFPKVAHECVFTIRIQKTENILHFEVGDNGQGADLEKYRSDDPNDGLNILNERIVNAFELAGYRRSRIPDIVISASRENGTVIKFDYPYAET